MPALCTAFTAMWKGLPLTTWQWFCLMVPVAFGLGWTNVSASLEEGEDNNTSTLSETTWLLSYGVRADLFGADRLALGVSLKRLVLDSGVGSGAGLGLDFGLNLKVIDHLTFGAVAKNVAADVKDERFDPTFRFGLNSPWWDNRINVAFDLESRENIDEKEGMNFKIHAGVEAWVIPQAAIRLGYDDENFTAGAGARIGTVEVNYSYAANDLVGGSHRFSLAMYFGDVFKKKNLKLPTPGGLHTGVVDQKVVLFWNPVRSADVVGYNIYLKSREDKWEKVNTDMVAHSNQGVVMDVMKGETYQFTVTSVNEKGQESDRAAVVEVRP